MSDLLSLLASWGPCKDCPADFNGDGTVNILDLLTLLANWGPCPEPIMGACCSPDGQYCWDTTYGQCLSIGGDWYEGEVCAEFTCPGSLLGDTIETAIPIPYLPYGTTGTTVGYTDDYDEVCPYPGSTSPDVVYVCTPEWDFFGIITLCNGSDYDTKLYIYEDEYTPGNPYACNDDACPGWVSEIVFIYFPAGHTYYIVIDGWGGMAGDYVLDIYEIMPSP